MKQTKGIVKNIPNMITMLRILGTIGVLFLEPFSKEFFIVYTLCGISDLLDGAVARALKVTSEFGARLDSMSDLIYYGVMLIKIFPVMWEILPKIIWIILTIVIMIRLVGYGIAAYKYHKMAALHTNLNKLSSAMTFFIPYFIKRDVGVMYCLFLCFIVLIAAIHDLVIHIRSNSYQTNMNAFGK